MDTNLLQPTLLLGFGNVDRQDDGVAWHVLKRVATLSGLKLPENPDHYEFNCGNPVDILFHLQLYPELADLIKNYSRVVFIDAHTGAVEEEIHFEKIKPEAQPSPFTHHLTAAMLLNITQQIYDHAPEGILVSVRGYEFDFSQVLSQKTVGLVDKASQRIIDLLKM